MVQAVFEDNEAEIIVASVSLPEFGRRLRDLGASETVAQETIPPELLRQHDLGGTLSIHNNPLLPQRLHSYRQLP